MRPTTEKMQEMYSSKRNSTLDKIQSAIDFIKDESRIVTKKELMELTGLSSGTFSAPHVIELLKENAVCQFAPKLRIDIEKQKTEKSKEKEIAQLLSENAKLLSKIQDLSLMLDSKAQKIQALEKESESLKDENALLRGKCQLYLEKLEALGVNSHKLSREKPQGIHIVNVH